MFKKQFTIQSNHQLKSSDRRRLRTQLKDCFPSLSEEEWENILPPKAGEIIVLKLSNKAIVYCFLQGNNENSSNSSADVGKFGQPIFVFVPEEEGGGGWFPTVYTLWKAPHLLPCFETNSQVSRFLLGAADLMLPGVYPPEDDVEFTNVQYGQRRSVVVRGNPMPFAVGVCCCSSVDIQKHGRKGKALKLVHYYGDNIWSLGDRSKPQGFSLEQIDSIRPMNNNDELHTCSAQVDEIVQSSSQLAIQDHNNNNNAEEEEEEKNVAEQSTSHHDDSQVDMDALLDRCFLQAAKCLIQDRHLPMEASKLFNDFILPSRPTNTTVIDWKKSSYKKLGAFMKSLSKRKLCKLKEGKGQLQVITINRNHPDYLSFIPHENSNNNNNNREAQETVSSNSTTSSIPHITEMWKPHQHMKHFLEYLQKDENALYSREDVRNAVQQYGREKGLWMDAERITLDEVLKDALFKGNTKGLTEEIPSTMNWKEMEQILLSRMQPFHVLFKPGEEEPIVRKGAVKPVRIVIEDRQGGRKHVTRIQGIETFGIEPEDFAQKAQIAFACASSVHSLPGKQHAMEVQCQGNVANDVCKWLQKFGIPCGWIEIEDKQKNKK